MPDEVPQSCAALAVPNDERASALLSVLERISSPVVILDAEGRIAYANAAAGWLVGQSPRALRGVDVLDLVHPGDRARVRVDHAAAVAGSRLGAPVEYRIRAVDGSWRVVVAVASNLADLSPSGGLLISVTDVTSRRAQEQTLDELAHRDPVTGLANRRALTAHIESKMATDEPIAVAFLDIDRFKLVNDCLGHTVGDAVLHSAGARIAALTPAGCLVAHFGADTFVVVIAGIEAARSVELVWELIGHLADPLFVATHELRMSVTAGVALRESASTAESLLRDGDAALTRAKSLRRGGVEVFTAEMRSSIVERLAMEIDLRHAVDRGELSLVLQPIVRLADGHVEGSEALLRWRRGTGELVPPAVFIPLAEETGLITPVGDFALGRAMAALRARRTSKVAVNLSARQLLDPTLAARVERLIQAWDVDAQSVAFEVTETAVIENYAVASESLSRLRALGCAVGLDDFGTGYSSLGYLRRLPVDFVKLDRELVADLDHDPQAARIVEAVVSLARSLGLSTIGEGVEHECQAVALREMGCDYGQGWHFGHPEPA